MKQLFAAALLATTCTLAAHATEPCRGKVVFDTVYQRGTGDKFDYYFQLRNATNKPVTVDVAIGGFPSTVSVFSPNLTGIVLPPNQDKEIKFASGSSNQINDGSVAKLYDTKGAPKPWVAAVNCK